MMRQYLPAAILCTLLAGSALCPGCLGPVPGDAIVPAITMQVTPVPPAPAGLAGSGNLSALALAPADLAGEYFVRDRSVIPYDETTQIRRELGWIRGYRVLLVHTGIDDRSITGIRQVIAVYPPDRIERAYAIEKEALLEQGNDTKRYEIAFQKLGDRSVAVRITGPGTLGDTPVYSVLFMKGTILEEVTMGGTATDYEVLRDAAQKAADRIP